MAEDIPVSEVPRFGISEGLFQGVEKLLMSLPLFREPIHKLNEEGGGRYLFQTRLDAVAGRHDIRILNPYHSSALLLKVFHLYVIERLKGVHEALLALAGPFCDGRDLA